MGLEPVDGPISAEVRPWGFKARPQRTLPQQRRTQATFLRAKKGDEPADGFYSAGQHTTGTSFDF